MSRKDCFKGFKDLLSGEFSNPEVRDMFEQLQQEQANAADDKSSAHDKLSNLAEQLSRDKELDNARKEHEFFRNLENQKQLLSLVRRFKNKKGGLKLSLLSWINGTQRGVEGARDSVRTRYLVLSSQLLDGFQTALKKSKVLKIFNTKEYEEDIANEIRNPGSTQDEHVKSIGAIVRKFLDKSSEMYKKNGIFFQDLEDRITRNFHDQRKLSYTSDSFKQRQKDLFSMSKEERKEKSYLRWRSIIEPLLNDETTKRGQTKLKDLSEGERNEFFRASFETLTQAQKINPEGEPLRLRIKKSRIFKWSNGASMVKYNRIYGKGTLQEAILSEFNTSARQNAILERMGESPGKFLDNVINITKEDKDLNMDISDFETRGVINTLKAAIGNPEKGDASIAAIGGNIRRANDISKLGGVLTTALTDILPISMETARFHGSLLKGTLNSVKNFLKAKSLQESKTIGSFLQTFAHNEIGVMHRFFESDVHTGLMSKLHQLSFKLNRLSWWDEGNRTSIAAQAAEHLGNSKNFSFEDMVSRDKKFGEDNVRILKSYNITGDEWDAIRKVPTKLENKTEYIIPESADEIPDSDIKNILRKEGRKRISKRDIVDRRQKIHDKFHGYFIDRTDHGIFSPDFNDQAQLFQGTASGTIQGEFMRFIAQYKFYSLSYMKRSFGRQIYGRGADSFLEGLLTGKGNRVALAQLMVYGSLMGYLSITAAALIRGKTPPDPFDVDTILESWARGGVIPLYGDYIFKPQSGYNQSLISNLAGPSGRDLEDLFKLLQAPFISSKPTHVAWQIARNNLKSAVPLFLKYPMDALIFNQIDDMITPGSTQKKIARLQKHGQNYFLPATF